MQLQFMVSSCLTCCQILQSSYFLTAQICIYVGFFLGAFGCFAIGSIDIPMGPKPRPSPSHLSSGSASATNLLTTVSLSKPPAACPLTLMQPQLVMGRKGHWRLCFSNRLFLHLVTFVSLSLSLSALLLHLALKSRLVSFLARLEI